MRRKPAPKGIVRLDRDQAVGLGHGEAQLLDPVLIVAFGSEQVPEGLISWN